MMPLTMSAMLPVKASANDATGAEKSAPFLLGILMNIYTAYVRANGYVIQTQIAANNMFDAISLLKGQYGADNLVHLPVQVS